MFDFYCLKEPRKSEALVLKKKSRWNARRENNYIVNSILSSIDNRIDDSIIPSLTRFVIRLLTWSLVRLLIR